MADIEVNEVEKNRVVSKKIKKNNQKVLYQIAITKTSIISMYLFFI